MAAMFCVPLYARTIAWHQTVQAERQVREQDRGRGRGRGKGRWRCRHRSRGIGMHERRQCRHADMQACMQADTQA